MTFQKIDELGLSEFSLRAVSQSLQGPRPFRYLIIAEEEGVTRVELVCALKGFSEFLLCGRQFHANANGAESFRRTDGSGVSVFAHPSDVHVAPGTDGNLASFLQG